LHTYICIYINCISCYHCVCVKSYIIILKYCRKEKDKLIAFQRRCNSFVMDVVSQLCFAGNTPPSDAVLVKLLGYITLMTKDRRMQFTKNMALFDTGVDPNPVFRSFLLQLIIKTRYPCFVWFILGYFKC